nr:glucosaminidase domain-containing protein [Bacilli bacterium]
MKNKEFVVNTLFVSTLIVLVAIFNFIDMKKNNKPEEETVTNAQVGYVENNEEREVVWDDLTMEELVAKLDANLKSDLTGTGYLYAKYALQYGVDPYLAVGISLHETGCNSTCSAQVVDCNNVGGQRFQPACYAGGTYGKYDTLEEGIEGFVRNIYNNYFAMGLTTADAMQAKYVGTGSTSWAPKVNHYIEVIKNS